MGVRGRFILFGDVDIVRYLLHGIGVDCNMTFQHMAGYKFDTLGSLHGATPLDLSRRILQLTGLMSTGSAEYQSILSFYERTRKISTDFAWLHSNLVLIEE